MGPALKTLTLEYRAFELFDGTTPAPPFSEGKLDDRQIYVFEAERIGNIPLQFGEDNPPTSESTVARKVMTWMVVYGTVVDPAAAVLSLGIANLSATLPTLTLAPLVFMSANTIGVYSPRCQSIPQGYSLKISNVIPLAGAPAILRLRIVQPASPEDEASWMSACCCKSGFIDNRIPRA